MYILKNQHSMIEIGVWSTVFVLLKKVDAKWDLG